MHVRHLLPALCCLLPALALAAPPPGECPQPRYTGQAPAADYNRVNPLPADRANRKAGKRLYLDRSSGSGCALCHGTDGDGNGPLAAQFDPRPRNFACAQTVNGIPDGQLAWIIRHGSPDTAMPAHPQLADDDIWRIVLHLRELARE